MKTLIRLSLIVLFFSSTISAQSFYPLEPGNRWHYQRSDELTVLDTICISVLKDTLCPNGIRYSYLSEVNGFIPSQFVRTDSMGIYYYNASDSSDQLTFNINMNIGDSLYSPWAPYFFITLNDVDTVSLFSNTTRILDYYLDGLQVATMSFSDRYGPILHCFYGDPPAPFPYYTKSLIGCVIGDSTFGITISLPDDNLRFNHVIHLKQNFPNPFNPSTTISYQLSANSKVSLKIYNALGQEIATLVHKRESAGAHTVRWNGKDRHGSAVASGVYLYRIEAVSEKGKFAETKKMVYLK